MAKSIDLLGNCNQSLKMDAIKEVPMEVEFPDLAHLRFPRPSVDLTSPGLMLTANASLVLGYLWLGWLSDGSQSELARDIVRGGVLPALIALAIFVMRLLRVRRGLSCGTLLLPVAAAIELCVVMAADASGSHFLAVAAGGMALSVAFLATGSVLKRERCGLRDRLHSLRQ